MFGPGLVPGRIPAGTDYLWLTAPWSASLPAGVSPRASNLELLDSVTHFQPFMLKTRAALPDVPLWNPHILGGRPYLANLQSAVFSPFSVPAYVLPFWHSLAVTQMMKLFVAAFGTFVLARSLGMRFAGALLAGTVFGFSQAMVDWVSWPLASIWSLLPWLLLLADRVIRRPGSLEIAGLSLLVALAIFGGHPEATADVVGAAVAWFVFRLLRHTHEWRSIGRRVLAFGIALAAGTCLAAIVLVPFLELLLSSWDYDFRRGSFGEQPLEAQYLRAFFMPDWWGRPTQAAISPFPTLPVYGHAFYVGALSLLLAAVALLVRPRAERVALAAVGLFALCAMVGLEPFVSVVTLLRGPAKLDKLFFYVTFCVAMLAGFGLDDLGSRVPRGRRRLVLVASALLLATPVVWTVADGSFSLAQLGPALEFAAGLGASEPAHLAEQSEIVEIRMGALLEWLVLAGAGLALVWGRLSGRFRGPLFAGAAVALIVLDLFKLGMGYNPAIPEGHAFQPSTGAIEYLQSRRPARFVGIDGGRSNLLLGLPPFVPNLAMRHGLYDARGYDFPVDRRFALLWSDTVARVPAEPRFSFASPTPRALRALGLLGVADVIQDVREPPLRAAGLRLVYEGPDARVYANEHALPRVFVASAQRLVPDASAALAAVTAPDFDARTAVVTERPLEGLARTADRVPNAAGEARLRSYQAERVIVQASTRQPGMLVLTDTHAPGWEVEVDGEPATVHRIDYLLRGVSLSPGRHRVEFRYRPASWRAGWIITLVTAVGLLATAAFGWRSRRARLAQRR